MGRFSVIFVFLLLFPVFAFDFSGNWKIRSENGSIEPVPNADGSFSVPVCFPGSALLYPEQPRYSFRPSEAVFRSKQLQMEIRTEGISGLIKAWLFVKDKDGAWFQSVHEFHLKPDEWNLLSVPLTSRDLLPVGHSAQWNGLYAGRIFAAGVSLYSDSLTKGKIHFKYPRFTGEREFPQPAFLDWHLPESGKKWIPVSSRFQLNKEYFNPFDDEKITVDFEVRSPNGKIERYPAFYNMECLEKHHFTRETVRLTGKPFWEFRFVPKQVGMYEIRLCGNDKTGKQSVPFYTEWRKFQAKPSDEPGFIRVSKKNPMYFEYENGRFFYPVGLNIHSNTDQRSENVFGFGHLPDCGNADYREYMDACSKAGLTLLEVWMAAWTYSIEWSSSRAGYYGTGWFNLENAWKLDRLLEYARKKKIHISLVLDNHGKLADICDPEWYDSPYNAKGIFAEANGAVLKNPADFWNDSRMKRATERRNRYICARWGADPVLFAIQLWSEVDLVASARRNYDNGQMIKWHAEQARFLKKNTQGNFLNASHVCGDIGNTFWWRKLLIDLPEMDHICSDAYRDWRIPIPDQFEKHYKQLLPIRKPALVTEFGGSSAASKNMYQRADVHGGIWASLFARQAGGPLLWWHDFVHINKLYPHYTGFIRFVKGLDLREPVPVFADLTVHSKPFFAPLKRPLFEKLSEMPRYKGKKIVLPVPDVYEGRALYQNNRIICGWIYHKESMFRFPEPSAELPKRKEIRFRLPWKIPAGLWRIFYYDPITNDPVTSAVIPVNGKVFAGIKVPSFRTDIAFKLYPENVR